MAKATGLSQVTVNQIASRLRQAGHVIEERGDGCARPSRRGRRMSFLRFNAASGYVLGIDIAPAAGVVLVAALNGNIVAEERRSVGTTGQLHPRPLFSLRRTTVTPALPRARVPRTDLMARGY